jgi:thioredoxin 1
MGAQQGRKQPSSLIRIIIVAALAIAVGTVFFMKQRPMPEKGGRPPGVQASEKTPASAPASLPRLVDLGSNRCQSCLAMVPVLEQLTSEYEGRMEVLFIDIWENPDAAGRYGIQLIPTQIFFDSGGKELFRHEGFFSREDILAKWKDLGFIFDG